MKNEEAEEREVPGKSLEDYLAQGRKWQKYANKAYQFLEKRIKNLEDQEVEGVLQIVCVCEYKLLLKQGRQARKS